MILFEANAEAVTGAVTVAAGGTIGEAENYYTV